MIEANSLETIKGTAVFVARDAAPSRALGLLTSQFETPIPFLAHGRPPFNELYALEKVPDASVLVVGMSHSPEAAEAEIASMRIAPEGTLVVMYADSSFCSTRSWFQPVRDRADLVCTCTQSEADLAAKLFSHARVVATGNPLWEMNYFAAQENLSNREALRKSASIAHGKHLVLVSLRKERDINVSLLTALVEAHALLPEDIRNTMQYRITSHPSEPDREAGLAQYRKIIGEVKAAAFTDLSVSELLASADLVINAGSGIGVEAMFMRLPTIELLTNAVLNELERLQGGNRIWQPAAVGASLAVVDAQALAKAIEDLVADKSSAAKHLRGQQERHFSAPQQKGASIAAMTHAIARML